MKKAMLCGKGAPRLSHGRRAPLSEMAAHFERQPSAICSRLAKLVFETGEARGDDDGTGL